MEKLCDRESNFIRSFSGLKANNIWSYRNNNRQRPVMEKFLFDHTITDVSGINWSLNGVSNDDAFVNVNDLSVDSFILIHHFNSKELAGEQKKRYLFTDTIIKFIGQWLKSMDMSGHVKEIGIDADSKSSNPRPTAKYKVAIADEPISKVFGTLLIPSHLSKLHAQQVFFDSVDVKVDVATTLTPLSLTNALSRCNDVFGIGAYEQLDRPSEASNCVQLKRGDEKVRAKAYNKFVETITSNGVSKGRLGCNVVFWCDSPVTSFQQAAQNTNTLQRGLTRIEITFYDDIPSLELVTTLHKKFRYIFLKDSNYTPINQQWSMLQPQNTCVLYDCLTGICFLGRWKDSRTRKINGFKFRPNSFNELMHAICFGSIYGKPIDIYLLCSDSYPDVNGTICLLPAQFHTRALHQQRVKNEGSRKDWKYIHRQFTRKGPEKRTFFFRDHHFYSRKKCHVPTSACGLNVPGIHASVRERCFVKSAMYESDFYIEGISRFPPSKKRKLDLIDTRIKNMTTMDTDKDFEVTSWKKRKYYGKEVTVFSVNDGYMYRATDDLEAAIARGETRFRTLGVSFGANRNKRMKIEVLK